VDQKIYNLIEGLKSIQESFSSIFHVNNTTSSKTLIASYTISNLTAKHSKSFTEGQKGKEVVKEYLVAIQLFGESLTLQEAVRVSLNANIVKFYINCITSSLQE